MIYLLAVKVGGKLAVCHDRAAKTKQDVVDKYDKNKRKYVQVPAILVFDDGSVYDMFLEGTKTYWRNELYGTEELKEEERLIMKAQFNMIVEEYNLTDKV